MRTTDPSQSQSLELAMSVAFGAVARAGHKLSSDTGGLADAHERVWWERRQISHCSHPESPFQAAETVSYPGHWGGGYVV
jgi:hypothetical protein